MLLQIFHSMCSELLRMDRLDYDCYRRITSWFDDMLTKGASLKVIMGLSNRCWGVKHIISPRRRCRVHGRGRH
jgi:hypothetical protein